MDSTYLQSISCMDLRYATDSGYAVACPKYWCFSTAWYGLQGSYGHEKPGKVIEF